MILLKFKKEIKGDSKADGHVGWINLDSVNLNCGRSISVRSGGTDRDTSTPMFSDIACSKSTDISSTELFMQSICGTSLEEASIHFLQTDGKNANQVYLTVTLDDPIVSSYSSGSGGERPREKFCLNFTKIKMEYTQFSGEDKKQASPKGWDLMSGKAW